MNHNSTFHLISDIEEKEGLTCILIGGFAVNYYKVSRNTADIDFIVTKEELTRIQHHLKDAGFIAKLSHDNFVRFNNLNLSMMDVDFIFVDKETKNKLLINSQKMKIMKKEFYVPSLLNLIALKLHSIKQNPKVRRFVDMPDIINLIRINKIDISDAEFVNICQNYGTDEIYNQIKETLN